VARQHFTGLQNLICPGVDKILARKFLITIGFKWDSDWLDEWLMIRKSQKYLMKFVGVLS
jgi:hypothetical protein